MSSVIRCYDCGRALTPEGARRRNVTVSTWGGVVNRAPAPGQVINGATTGRVDLCPDCDAKRARQTTAVGYAVVCVLGALACLYAVLFIVSALSRPHKAPPPPPAQTFRQIERGPLFPPPEGTAKYPPKPR